MVINWKGGKGNEERGEYYSKRLTLGDGCGEV